MAGGAKLKREKKKYTPAKPAIRKQTTQKSVVKRKSPQTKNPVVKRKSPQKKKREA